MITCEQEKLAKKVLDCVYEVHSFLGPGLLESTYGPNAHLPEAFRDFPGIFIQFQWRLSQN
jgi:hypothetical protein